MYISISERMKRLLVKRGKGQIKSRMPKERDTQRIAAARWREYPRCAAISSTMGGRQCLRRSVEGGLCLQHAMKDDHPSKDNTPMGAKSHRLGLTPALNGAPGFSQNAIVFAEGKIKMLLECELLEKAEETRREIAELHDLALKFDVRVDYDGNGFNQIAFQEILHDWFNRVYLPQS